MLQPPNGNGTGFPLRLWTVSLEARTVCRTLLILYIPFVLPYFKFPETEYETLASAFGRAQIEFLAMVTVILAAFAMTRYVDRKPLTTVGLNSRAMFKDFGVGSGVGIVLLLALLGILGVFNCVRVGTGRGPFDSELLWTTLALLFNTVQQEVLIHGYVQQMVRTKFGSAAGVVVFRQYFWSFALDVVSRRRLTVADEYFAAGCCSDWLSLQPFVVAADRNSLRLELRSGPILGMPLTSVDLWNSDLVYVVGSDYLTGGSMGLEGGMVGSVVLVAAAAIMYRKWMQKLSKNHELEHSFP
ncbi:MAG: hypothetical protein IPP40_13510 [bacterium]|nr:hypothetical protein [bacterium]